AGVNRFSVQQHRASSALAPIAADLCSGEPEMITEKFNQGPTIFDFETPFGAVQGETYVGSRNTLRCTGWRCYLSLNFRCRRGSGERRASSLEKFPPGKLLLLFGFAHGETIYEKRGDRSRKNEPLEFQIAGQRQERRRLGI